MGVLTGGNCQDALPVITKENYSQAVLSVYIAANNILASFHYYQDGVHYFLKWMCHVGGKAFKRRLVHSVTLTIMG